MELEALNFEYLLLNYYKTLKIKEDELCVLFMIDHLLKGNNSFITSDLLALKMNFSPKKIDDILVKLIQKNLLEYETKGKNSLKTSLKPLASKLFLEYEKNMFAQESISYNEEFKKELDLLYKQFEKTFNRKLAEVEKAKIEEWMTFGYEIKQIQYSLSVCAMKNSLDMKSIEKNLIQNKISNDVKKEGYSFSTDDDISLNKDEDIKILKTKWVKDEQ